MCGIAPIDPGPNRGELVTGHGGWGTQNLEVDGANTRLATIEAGGSVDLRFNYTVGVQCSQGQLCPLQLQIGTNVAKTGCVFAGDAIGDKLKIATHSGSDDMTLSFGTPGTYAIMVDPAANSNGCGSAWTNGQPTDLGEIIAFVCVTAP